MSDIIPFAATGVMAVPAHVAALFDADSNIAPRVTINQLSYKGKVWRRIVDGEETKLTRKNADGDTEPVPIVGLVVLDHNKGRSRAFYEGDFVDGENKAPRCASMDGIKPDAGIAEPISKTCASCPNAVKGSKITDNGKQSTLCSANKRIAVVPAAPAALKTHPVLLLRIAQTSVWDKNNPHEAQGWYAWDQYLDMLRARGAKHTAAVETRVKFDLDKPYPKLLFTAARWLNEDEAKAAKQRCEDSADEIAKVLNGAGDDGVAGQPGIPAEGVDQADGGAAAAQAAADAAAKVEADKATKVAADKAAKAKKAADAAAKKAAADAAAAAAQAAAEAAAAAAAAAAQSDDGGMWGGDDAPAAAAAPAAQTAPPAAAAAAATVETGVPAGLADLMAGWDA
ncbi:hypothetical protein [Burkholderia cenocepacia]|uniref:hypothetical protein n=1 Tax=Burkholderia cenocepacia TaxID=95486 RepID=UPI00264F99C4|nr:hypothetical protein [Burkholderia cenocepacia]MDN7537019.1 hypothetical protein [Burkholderia cenocepacia]